MSNIFAKVLDSSKHSETIESNLEKDPIKKNTNDDASSNKKSLQELNLTEKQISKIRDIRRSSSVDESHISNEVLKPTQNIFLVNIYFYS
ncbi:hypothetical protein M0802_012698 [Mischocyttarus mexicanus]|nr:hypothetical protein M0802_012698 [Mischocyttarus mexicanus]